MNVPVYRAGEVVAEAVIDNTDAALASGQRWMLSPDGYAYRSQISRGRKTSVGLHRAVMGLEVGDRREVDHRNGDPLDNRRSNLRIVTHAQNGQNVVGRPDATSQHRGVSWHAPGRKWRAQGRVEGRVTHLGYFDDEAAAADAAAAHRALHQPFSEERTS